jgi:hypothetical protein
MIAFLSLFIGTGFLLGGCLTGVSAEEIATLKAKCQSGETPGWGFYARFYDFDCAQLDKIEVRHARGDQTIESFSVYPEIIERGKQGEPLAQAKINYSDFRLSDSYHFTVAGQYVFTLSNIQMKGYGGGTMFGGYGFMCDLGSYQINGTQQEYAGGAVDFRRADAVGLRKPGDPS